MIDLSLIRSNVNTLQELFLYIHSVHTFLTESSNIQTYGNTYPRSKSFKLVLPVR